MDVSVCARVCAFGAVIWMFSTTHFLVNWFLLRCNWRFNGPRSKNDELFDREQRTHILARIQREKEIKEKRDPVNPHNRYNYTAETAVGENISRSEDNR